MTNQIITHCHSGVPSGLRRLTALATVALSLVGACLAGASSAQASIPRHHARVGLLARAALDLAAQGKRVPSSRAQPRESAAGPVYGVFLRGRTSAIEIASAGAKPGTVLAVGSTADATLAQLQALAELPGVTEVDLAGQASKRTDVSIPTIHAAELGHAATATVPHMWSGSLPGGFTGDTGKGVVIGVVDSGIDILNEDFKTGAGTRIKSLWDQAASGSGSPPGSFTYGRDCSQSAINSATCGPFNYLDVSAGGNCNTPVVIGQPIEILPEQDCIGHGTHVAGIAAANGRAGTTGQYIGVAPESDMVVVKSDGDLAHIVDGVNYTFQRATALGEPASVNLSLGVNSGPHDGTSMFESLIDALSGPGRAISASAGNQGTRGAVGNPIGGQLWYHASGSISPGQVRTNTLVIGSAPVLFDIWYNAGNQLAMTVNGPGGFHLGPVAPDRGGVGIGLDGVCESANPNATAPTANDIVSGNSIQVLSCTHMPNGDNEIQFFIFNPNNPDLHVNGCQPSPCVDGWNFQLQAGGSGPTVGYHAWAFDQADYFIHNGEGNDASTVSAPASAYNVISVGSLAARNSWPALGGTRTNASPVGALSFFSAVGPTRDGRQGIDIVAPGENVGSSLSSTSTTIRAGCEFPNASFTDCVTPDGAHLFLSGTSMASPHAAGAVALMLAQQPTMTIDQARRALGDASALDGFTGATPDPAKWGTGKLQMGPGAMMMTPSQGGVAGGNTIDVMGFDFLSGMTVKVNGSTVTVTPVGANHVQFTAPPAPGGQPGMMPVHLTNPDGSIGTDAYTYLAPGPLHPTPPTRISDTRPGSGYPNAGSTIGPNGFLTVQVTGTFGPTTIPAGASAAVVNLAVTNASNAGNLVIWPFGAPQPLVSNINWAPGHTVSNLTEVPLSLSGQLRLFNNGPGTVDVILDVNGYYTLTVISGDALHPLPPERLADTRPASGQPYAGPPIGPRGELTIQVDGALLAGGSTSNIPSAGVDAVVLELTATNATSASNLAVFPGCAVPLNEVPVASNLNFAAGQTLANRTITQVGTNACNAGNGHPGKGYVTIFNNTGVGSTDVVVDTGGWFQALSGAGGLFVPVTPARINDTRPSSHVGAFYAFGPHTTQKIQVAGHAGVPTMGLGVGQSPTAVVLHVTTVTPQVAGFLISYPSGGEPNAADLNFAGGDVIGNLVQVALAGDGTVLLTNHANGYTDIVIDIEGWYT